MNNLQKFMRDKGWGYKELALALGTCTSNAHRIANGRQMPRPELLEKIMDITGGAVTANDFHASLIANRPRRVR